MTHTLKHIHIHLRLFSPWLRQTLDEVNISVETCDPSTRNQDANSPGGVGSGGGSSGAVGGGGAVTAPPSSLPQVPQSKYSFIHKVVDGITIIVNTVNVKFSSAAFTASVQVCGANRSLAIKWYICMYVSWYVCKYYRRK